MGDVYWFPREVVTLNRWRELDPSDQLLVFMLYADCDDEGFLTGTGELEDVDGGMSAVGWRLVDAGILARRGANTYRLVVWPEGRPEAD